MDHADAPESETPSPDDDEPQTTEISVAQSCPGRAVFSEADNPEGWIGTDLTVDVEP